MHPTHTAALSAGRVGPADGSEWWWCKVGPAAGATSCAYAGHHTRTVQVCEGGEEEYDSVGSCGSHSCSDGEGGGAGIGQLASGNTTDDSGIDRYLVTLVLSCIMYCATQHLAWRGGGAGERTDQQTGAAAALLVLAAPRPALLPRLPLPRLQRAPRPLHRARPATLSVTAATVLTTSTWSCRRTRVPGVRTRPRGPRPERGEPGEHCQRGRVCGRRGAALPSCEGEYRTSSLPARPQHGGHGGCTLRNSTSKTLDWGHSAG